MAIHADLVEGKCSIPSQRNGLSNQPERERERRIVAKLQMPPCRYGTRKKMFRIFVIKIKSYLLLVNTNKKVPHAIL